MKTEFKIFKGGCNFLEGAIKEYQEKHNVEIKSVMFLDSYTEYIIGVLFEKRSEYEELEDLKYKSSKWLYSE